MKHIFVINPAAGKTDPANTLLPRLQSLLPGGRRSWKST